ncbi:MAG: ABC transporter substrate-binding protein [Rhodospirillales bacterium 70-18]|nr:ABC transporter substrate-binding protein [Rhodospirillales bacterium]OJY68261.1 MAG: ABC transporter substrate-binding protein [Rhodospirillales bacterium 70-18]
MPSITRRTALQLATAAAAGLPRFAIAQADTRPVITIAVQGIANTNTLDNLREQSNVGERTSLMFNERPIDLDYTGDLALRPGLATAWRRIDDATVELSLRPGVKFHNGDEMTAEDVAFRFSPAMAFGDTRPVVNGKTLPVAFSAIIGQSSKQVPAEVPPVARRLWPGLDRVEIVDRHTVRFVNATPDVTIEGRLAAMGSEIVSRRAFEAAATWLDYARKPVGTGPYKVREFTPDTALVLDAHDEYWGGRPPVRTIRLVQVPEVAARINGLLSGQYQFACDIPPDQIQTVEQNAAFEIQGGPILNHRMTTWDMHEPSLRDPRVRQAIGHAIDRQAIIDGLWAGRTRVPAGMQWEFFGDMFIADWKVPAFDPAKARGLLKAAGYKGEPIPYRLLNNYYTNQVATAQVLVEMWRQVGLNMQIQMVENWTQIRAKTSQRGVRDWSAGGTLNDPVGSIVSNFGPNGAAQQAGEYENAEFSRMCVVLETSADRALRRRAFKRMLEIAERDDPAYTILHQNATFTAKRRDIKWQAGPSFAMDFRPGRFAA